MIDFKDLEESVSFQTVKEISSTRPNKPILRGIKIEHKPSEIDQGYYIRAEATVYLPMERPKYNFKIEYITSGGLYGLPLSMEEEEAKAIAKEEINELINYLKMFNVLFIGKLYQKYIGGDN